MSAEAVKLRALILQRQLAGESHLRLSLLEPESGRREAFFRQAKSSKSSPPDSFDVADFQLEPAKGGGSWFVRDFRLVHRHRGLSRSYAVLQLAAQWTLFLTRNAEHCQEPATVYELAVRTLSGMETTEQADAALLKGYYLFARQEGWPVKEAWLSSLPRETQADAIHMLNTPLEELAISPKQAARLHQSLKNWLATCDGIA
ncbi:MAG: hypothetical protein AAGA45_02935 [Verrucomicrobiota bacterium]